MNEALRDGVLLDVTPIAHQANFAYPTYLSAVVWKGSEVHQSESLVQALLEDFGFYFRRDIEDAKFRTRIWGLEPRRKQRGWPLAAFPRPLIASVTTYPSETCGGFVVILQEHETLDFRVPRTASGSFFPM